MIHIKFNWIKGHNNHPQNERCDMLAVIAAKSNFSISDIINEESNKKL